MSEKFRIEITYCGKTFESIDAAIDWKKRQKTMSRNPEFRRAIRAAINEADIPIRDKIVLRARFIGCNRDEAEDFIEDCLVDRGTVARGFALDSAPMAPDWPSIIKEIIAIIKELLANK